MKTRHLGGYTLTETNGHIDVWMDTVLVTTLTGKTIGDVTEADIMEHCEG